MSHSIIWRQVDPDSVQDVLGKTNGLKFLRLCIRVSLRLEQGPSFSALLWGKHIWGTILGVCVTSQGEFVDVRYLQWYWEQVQDSRFGCRCSHAG